MIVSKQALSYMKIRDVALLFKVSTDPNLFFAKKRRITGSLQFLHSVVLHIFIELSRIFHSCQKSKIMHEHIKVKELSSWYEFRPSVSVIITMSYDIFGHYSNLLWSWHILIVPVTYLQVVNALYILSGAGFVWSPHVCRVIRLYADHWSQLNLA